MADDGKEIHKVGPYILGATLGFGKVKSAFHVDTGALVAVKIIEKKTMLSNPNMAQKLEREIAVMKLIKHPHLLQLYEVYETAANIFLIVEHAPNGELFDYLIHRGALDMDAARAIFQQIIEGLGHCHRHLVCHRDLKPENLLLDAQNSIKIADFGMAALQTDDLLETSCGSPHYASPEVVCGKKYNGMKADVWSCGVILYALVSGKLPFDDENIRKLLQKVKAGVFSMPQFLSTELQDLISRMLTVDVDERMTIEDVRSHPWYQGGVQVPSCTDDCIDTTPRPVSSDAVVDGDVMRSLRALRFGANHVELLMMLQDETPNLAQAYYWLLENRRISPPLPPSSAKTNRKGLTRVQSDTKVQSLEEADIPEVTRQSSNDSKDAKPKKRKLQRRLSLGAAAFSAIKMPFKSDVAGAPSVKVDEPARPTSPDWAQNSQGDRGRVSPIDESPRSKGWFKSLLGRSSERFTAQRREAKEKEEPLCFFSDRPSEKLSKRIAKELESVSATYTISGSKFKVKYSADGKPLRFDITVSSQTDDIGRLLHYVCFVYKQGNRVEYRSIVTRLLELTRPFAIQVDDDIRNKFVRKKIRRRTSAVNLV